MQSGPDSIPPEAVEMIKAFCATAVIIALGIPLIRALARRWERGSLMPPPASPDVTDRLERIEQAIDAVAIEVERLAESQRFVAKLMAEQKQRALEGGGRASDDAAR
ncbi:MAG TPA: hypothetical protein VHV78_06420 [Gemmatimonadaceae bacterium]|nr:hypothetical protein [Gemmatimonadaceae bacterium]